MAKIIKLLISIITVILMAYAPITTSIDFKFNNQIIQNLNYSNLKTTGTNRKLVYFVRKAIIFTKKL